MSKITFSIGGVHPDAWTFDIQRLLRAHVLGLGFDIAFHLLAVGADDLLIFRPYPILGKVICGSDGYDEQQKHRPYRKPQ